MPLLLSTATVANVTGATVRMIDHWTRTGLIRPSGQDASGKGSRRRYTFQDIVVLRAILTLREGNCPLQKIRTAIRFLRANYPNEPATHGLAKLALLTDGKRVLILTDEHQMMDVVTRQFHITWAVPLGRIIRETSQRLDAMPYLWEEPAIVGGRSVHLSVSRERGGDPFVARCRELPGAVTEAKEKDEALAQLRKLVAFALEREPQANRGHRLRRTSVAS